MRNFILGVIATFGGLCICKKMYDKGQEDAIENLKESKKKDSNDSSKDKKKKAK